MRDVVQTAEALAVELEAERETSGAPALFAFEVWLADHRTVLNDRTLAKARYRFLLRTDAFPVVPFHLVRGRKLGLPVQTPALEETCRRCRRPDLRAGVEVEHTYNGARGLVVDGGTYVEVLFHGRGVLPVSPHELRVVGKGVS